MEKVVCAVLINPPAPQLDDDRLQPPGGLISIATVCQKNGYDVQVTDLAGKTYDADIIRYIPEADVYGISLYTVTYKNSIDIINALRRRNPSSFFVAGGPHASALPDEVKKDFNCVVCGEGEYAFLSILNLINKGAPNKIPKIFRAAPIENLDELPFPNFYRNSDIGGYKRKILGLPAICLYSSRGCDHKCHFCNSRIIERGCWRARSPENVISEINWHISHNYKTFRFDDDNFLADPERAMEICRQLEPLGVKYRIFARAESLTPQICNALSGSGCVHIGIGVESMSDTMLTLMGKAANVNDIQNGIQAAHDANIKIRGLFICGFPGETDETVNESIKNLKTLHIDEALVFPCIPYPGTDLYAQPEMYGITKIEEDFSKYVQIGTDKASGYVMETDKFDVKDVMRWRNMYIDAFRQLNIAWSDEGGFVK